MILNITKNDLLFAGLMISGWDTTMIEKSHKKAKNTQWKAWFIPSLSICFQIFHELYKLDDKLKVNHVLLTI